MSSTTEIVILLMCCFPALVYQSYGRQDHKTPTSFGILLKLLPEVWIFCIVNSHLYKVRNFEVQKRSRQLWVRRAVVMSALAECFQLPTPLHAVVIVVTLCLSQISYSKAIHAIHINNWLFDVSSSAFQSQEEDQSVSRRGFMTRWFSIISMGMAGLSIFTIYPTELKLASWILLLLSWTVALCNEKISYVNVGRELTVEEREAREAQSFIVFWGAIWKLLYITSTIAPFYSSNDYNTLQISSFRLICLYTSDYFLATGLSL